MSTVLNEPIKCLIISLNVFPLDDSLQLAVHFRFVCLAQDLPCAVHKNMLSYIYMQHNIRLESHHVLESVPSS
jgi:hypothetical protein